MTCKINFNNWWGEVEPNSRKVFEYLFQDVSNNYDAIEIYSVFGNKRVKKYGQRTLRVQFSGESFYNDVKQFHINFVPSENEFCLPYGYFHLLKIYSIEDIPTVLEANFLKKREKDLAFSKF